MYPDSDFARPVSSFRKPAPLNPIDPDYKPDLTVCINASWVPYIIGSLRQLLLQSTWKTRDPDELNRAQGQAQLLISMFIEGCPDLPTMDAVFGITLEDDMSQTIRVSPDDKCIIQMYCVDHWEDWYDPRECIASGSTQGGPEDPPEVGGSKEACYPLAGNGKLLLPYFVYGGDVITVSGASGGWNGGALTWACPSGGIYEFGTCGPDLATVSGDPIPTLPHMRLIGHLIDADIYFDAYNTSYHVPTYLGEQDVEFLANDSVLSDNFGSISLCVKVERTSQQVGIISITTAIINNRAILSKSIVGVGDTFDFTLVHQTTVGANPYDGKFILDTPATLKVVSVTDWTPGTGWQWFDPDTGASGAPTVGAQQNTTGFAGNAVTQATVRFQLVSIP